MVDRDEGGDPACWAHLDLAGAGTPEAASLVVDDAVLAAVARGAGDGIVVADHVRVLADPTSGAVTGITAIVRDDTARRAELRELRERINALEASAEPS